MPANPLSWPLPGEDHSFQLVHCACFKLKNFSFSNAKPKIADYPFTTIVPNLGVCDLFSDNQPLSTSAADPAGSSAAAAALVIADIPGLLEGAHAGVGLGMAFLRHVQRCR